MSGETVTMIEPYIVWMWQHYALSAFPCETLERAVSLSEAIQDAGDGSPECIEGPEGIVSDEAVEAIVKQIRAAERASRAERPPITHGIKVKAPGSEESAWWDSYASLEDAEADLAILRARFGDARVTLHEHRR